MDRDFIYRQVLVWLEVEGLVPRGLDSIERMEQRNKAERLAESLTNHLCNNWEMIERTQKAWETIEREEKATVYCHRLNCYCKETTS